MALDLVFLLDGSGSISSDTGLDPWQALVNFLIAFVESVDIGPEAVQIGLIEFSSDARILAYLSDFNKQELLDYIQNQLLPSGGMTNILDALLLADDLLTPQYGDRLCA